VTNGASKAIVIGASAGALEVLSVVLPALPADFGLPVLVVVHVPPDKKSVLVELFQHKCKLAVQEAEDKEPIRPGTIYFAPADYHLLVEKDGNVSLSSDEPVLFSRPSIDVLFESAADAYGSELIGVVLTGANRDGAGGLKAIVDAGGTAIVQCPDDAFAPAMPQAALAACPSAEVLPIAMIAARLQEA
jgi:two-component system, chemotaxis family, protein-glutamate methylesterase/glutaminase